MATKKLKKQNKGLPPQTKRTLTNVFKSIISNQSCIDGAKESPWWIGLIFFLLSVLLPVMPITINASKSYGSSFIAGNNYGADRGIANTFETLKTQNYEFKVQNGLLTFYKDGAEYIPTDDFVASDIITDTSKGADYKNYNFLVYVTNKSGSDLSNLINGHDNILGLYNQKFEIGTLNKYDEAKKDIYEAQGTTFYTPNFLLLTKDTIAMALYKNGTTTSVSSTYSGLDWSKTSSEDLITRTLNVDPTLTGLQKTKAILDNWKGVLNESYITQWGITMRNTSLIYLGVYAALVIFMGLMVFLLTRGKNNIFNTLTFLNCELIACWAAFTPAVLGMILGFIFGSNVIGQMGFIVLVSLRVMWLSMRQLRPIQ